MSYLQDDNSQNRESQLDISLVKGFSQRLGQRMAEMRLSQADLVKATGATKSSISAFCTAQRLPNVEVLFPLAKVLGVRAEWLVLGTGPMLETINVSARDFGIGESSNAPFGGALKLIPMGQLPPWRISLPIVDLQIASGLDRELEKIVEDFVIDPSLLPLIGNDHLKYLAVGDMPTDALAPNIPQGSKLIIDTNDCVLREGVFVFKYGQNLQVKRLRPFGINGVELISENPLYSPQIVEGESLQQFKIMGRVVVAISKT